MIGYLGLGLYLFIGFVVGYCAARTVYREGTIDRIVRPGSTGYAFFVWFLLTVMWPLYLLMAVLMAVHDSRPWQSLGERLFG